MKIVLIAVGKLKKSFFYDGVEEYIKRIGHYVGFTQVEVRDGSGDKAVIKEAENIKAKLEPNDFVVALHDVGREFDSKKFSEFIVNKKETGQKRIVFIVGGAYGLDKSVIENADLVLSLSKFTMPHELARLVFTEQLYRAFTIEKGEPYHH